MPTSQLSYQHINKFESDLGITGTLFIYHKTEEEEFTVPSEVKC